jgi:hypothetical protein
MLKTVSFALLVAMAGTGCVVRAHAYTPAPTGEVYVDEEPPAPRVWITETRPGYVYMQGRWDRRGNQWAWSDGHWERERAGQSWSEGRWETRGNRHVYVQGRWENGGGRHEAPPPPRNDGPVVRDHRHEESAPQPPPPPADNGPVIRDHRH